jgi:NAD(P)-dependent dehydrogenase (short-subunit alcohol dehydrogenase family)
MNDLTNKVIVVTGGMGLLGEAFVSAIREAGGRCIVADLNCETDLDHDRVRLDITQPEQLRAFLAQLEDQRIKLDGWVNNAYPRTPDWGAKFEDIPFESWQKNVDMHLNGYFLCSQLALEYMRKQGRGSLVSIGSIYGVVGPDFSVYEGTELTMPAAYAAIKGGIVNLTRYLAAYYGPHGIRVNCLSPGGVFDHQPASFVEQYEKKVPLQRMARPEDITSCLVFLLSEGAAYLTGQNLIVDGGWTIV